MDSKPITGSGNGFLFLEKQKYSDGNMDKKKKKKKEKRGIYYIPDLTYQISDIIIYIYPRSGKMIKEKKRHH